MANNDRGLLPLPDAPALPAPAGRGGGQGCRRRGNRTRPPRDANIRPPRVGAVPPNGPPRPQHLATEATPDRNDPLWSTGLGGAELQPLPNVEYVYSTFEALPRVTSVIHTSYQTASPSYSRRIPEAALAYYCACASWYRALSLQAQNSLGLSVDEERFVEQYSSLQLEAPMLLAHYLSGFGNTRVPSGRDVRFRMPERPAYVPVAATANGWFGTVGVATQNWYSQYPCLAVYAARMLAELAPVYAADWYLPAAVLPVLPGGRGPSRALLGYGPRSRLSRTQINFYEGVGIRDGGPFPSANRTFALNVELLLAIQGELQQVKSLKLSPVPSSIVGSQAQLARVFVEDELVELVDRTATLESPYRLPHELTFPASAYCYRVVHDVGALQNNSVAAWCIWRYRETHANDWRPVAEAANAYRDLEPALFNLTEFRTTPFLMRARLEALEQAIART